MRLAIVTDEIDTDLEHAARVAEGLGIRSLELRMVDGVNVVDLAPDALRRVRELLRGGGFDCCGIAGPFLKCSPDEDHTEVLERELSVAAELGAPRVRTFSWWRGAQPEEVRSRLLPVLASAVERTRSAGLRLVLENEHMCNVGTGAEAAWYLERLPDLGLIWDPGNEAMVGGRPFPDGYRAVRGRVDHVHVKDVANGAWALAGEGVCQWGEQLKALAAEGYEGMLSIETHIHEPSPEAASRSAVAALRRVAEDAGVPL
jgi:sugar phosphate isomerase/epimerase